MGAPAWGQFPSLIQSRRFESTGSRVNADPHLIEEQHGMGARRDGGGYFGEVERHPFGVAARQHQAGTPFNMVLEARP